MRSCYSKNNSALFFYPNNRTGKEKLLLLSAKKYLTQSTHN